METQAWLPVVAHTFNSQNMGGRGYLREFQVHVSFICNFVTTG